MAAYVLANVVVHDSVHYEDYRRQVPATLERYNGRFVVRGGSSETLEGDWQPGRLIVLEFPSLEQARAWYHSPEYQEILPVRLRNADSKMIIVEGV